MTPIATERASRRHAAASDSSAAEASGNAVFGQTSTALAGVKHLSQFVDAGTETGKSTESEFEIGEPEQTGETHTTSDNLEEESEPWYTPIFKDDIRALSPEEIEAIKSLVENLEVDYEKGVNDVACSNEFRILKQMLDILKMKLECTSRTAKLWLEYLRYIQVLKDFIRAERTGNWSLHLQSVGKMLNLFAATGHVHYAKSARMYLQQMLELETNFPWVHTSFAEHGYHTVRRSDRFWAGIWTDLTIEQVMMRSIKSRGGLTRGRGVTESVRTMWINTAHRCSHVHEAMTELTGLAHTTSNQHKEMGESRRQHDNRVLAKLIDWFEARNPFDPNMQGLCSLSSGVTVNDTDNINCDNAM